jgi:hypothetical protein
MSDKQPWTETQFKAAMKKAGWRLNSKVGTYTHKETGKVYHPFNWMAEVGEDWRQWAAARMTPPF